MKALLPIVVVIAAMLFVVVEAWPRMDDGSADMRRVHRVMNDEATILTGVLDMIARGDLDHNVQVYPGLYPYQVALVRVGVGADAPFSRTIEGTRIVSLITMLLAMLVSFFLFAKLATPWAAAAFVAIFSMNPETIVWASRIHPDAWLLLFDHAALACFALAVRHADDRRWLWAAAALAGLSAGTKLVGVFILAAMFVWIVWSNRKKPSEAIRLIAITGGIFAAFFLMTTPRLVSDPFDTINGFRTQHFRNWRGRADRLDWIDVFFGSRGIGWSGALLTVVGIAFAFADRRRSEWRAFVLFAIGFTAYLVAGVRLALPRYGAPAMWPLLFVGLAALTLATWDRRVRAAIAVVALILFVAIDAPAMDEQRADDVAFGERPISSPELAMAEHIANVPACRSGVMSSPMMYVPPSVPWKYDYSLEVVNIDEFGCVLLDDFLRRANDATLRALMSGRTDFVATATVGSLVLYGRKR